MFSWPRVESRRKLSQTSSAVTAVPSANLASGAQLEDHALAVRREIGGLGHQPINRIRLVLGARHQRVEQQRQPLRRDRP